MINYLEVFDQGVVLEGVVKHLRFHFISFHFSIHGQCSI
jgi:hypothetical protein